MALGQIKYLIQSLGDSRLEQILNDLVDGVNGIPGASIVTPTPTYWLEIIDHFLSGTFVDIGALGWNTTGTYIANRRYFNGVYPNLGLYGFDNQANVYNYKGARLLLLAHSGGNEHPLGRVDQYTNWQLDWITNITSTTNFGYGIGLMGFDAWDDLKNSYIFSNVVGVVIETTWYAQVWAAGIRTGNINTKVPVSLGFKRFTIASVHKGEIAFYINGAERARFRNSSTTLPTSPMTAGLMVFANAGTGGFVVDYFRFRISGNHPVGEAVIS